MAVTKIRGNTQILPLTITDAEIASAAAIALSKLAEPVIQADGGQAFTANQDFGGFKATGLGTPSNPTDASTKAYVDGVASGLQIHTAVRAATTANITLVSAQTVDGVAVIAGDRVLVKDQTAGQDNGIYVVSAGAWTRATDMDATAETLSGIFVFVTEGTTNNDTGWVLGTADPITLGTTPLVWTQFTAAGSVIAGNGLTKTGNTVDVVGGDGLVVAADLVSVGIDTAAGLKFDASTPKKIQVALDGSSLSVSGSGLKVNPAKFITREAPTGTVNGANVTFTLAATPIAGSESLFLNGILQEPGTGNDYTIAGGTVTYLTAPLTGDRLRASYMVA